MVAVSYDISRLHLRTGRKSDASALAELVNYAGEGIPVYLWQNMAEGEETAWDVGRSRASRDEGAFSYRNAIMAELTEDPCAGCLIGYSVGSEPEPITDDTPPMFRPMQELENLALNSWYVNVLAVYPRYRGRGLGTALLDQADMIAERNGLSALSIMVSDVNTGAMRLYERHGFKFAAMRPMVKEAWENPGRNWVLLIKTLV